MSERIEVTVNTFHGERVLPIEGEWSAWNETTLAVKMTPAAEREMVKAGTIHGRGSSCTCGGMRLPEPVDSDNPERTYLVPLAWAGPIGQVYTLPPGVAAAVATCERWLNDSNRSAAAALLGAKGGAAGRGASKRRDVDYSALGKRGGRPRKSCEICGSHPAYRKGVCVACHHAIEVHGATRADAHMVECDRRKCARVVHPAR